MNFALKQITALVLSLFVTTSAFAHGHCGKYEENQAYMAAIRTVASRMQYKALELCALPTLADIYVSSTSLVDSETGEVIPHSWVTLHYNEYSCQYFVRNSDQSLTKSNCYNTW